MDVPEGTVGMHLQSHTQVHFYQTIRHHITLYLKGKVTLPLGTRCDSLPSWKETRYPFKGRLSGPQGRSEDFREEKFFFALLPTITKQSSKAKNIKSLTNFPVFLVSLLTCLLPLFLPFPLYPS